MRSAAQIVIPIIALRAIVLWGLIRLVFAAVPLAGGEPFGSMPVPPIGVVLLSYVVTLIDIHMRGERILWANLGVTPLGIAAASAAATIPAELIFALVLR